MVDYQAIANRLRIGGYEAQALIVEWLASNGFHEDMSVFNYRRGGGGFKIECVMGRVLWHIIGANNLDTDGSDVPPGVVVEILAKLDFQDMIKTRFNDRAGNWAGFPYVVQVSNIMPWVELEDVAAQLGRIAIDRGLTRPPNTLERWWVNIDGVKLIRAMGPRGAKIDDVGLFLDSPDDTILGIDGDNGVVSDQISGLVIFYVGLDHLKYGFELVDGVVVVDVA
jgi:hypothetical protein